MSTGAPVEKATPIREPSVALLCVDSADGEIYNADGYRTGDNTPASLYINRQGPLMFGYMTRVSLTEVNMQWNIPNVNATNNTMTVAVVDDPLVNGVVGVRRITLTPGFRSPAQLCADVASALTAAFLAVSGAQPILAGIGFDCSIEELVPAVANTTKIATTPTVKLEVTGPYKFYIIPYNFSGATPVFGAGSIQFPVLQDDLTNMMGLTPSVSNGAPAWTVIDGSYASFQYTPYIDIVSNLLTKNQQVNDGSTRKRNTSGKLARIYLSNEQIEKIIISATYDAGAALESASDNIIGTSPFVFRREFKVPKVIQWNTTENVDVIDLQVLDYLGNTVAIDPRANEDGLGGLAITNTADFQFTIQVTEV
jgi:hypothetical protein